VEDDNGIRIHRVGAPNYQASSWETEPLVWTTAYLDYIRSNIALSQFDVIHTHGIDFALLVQFLAHVCQVPIVSQFHVCFRARADIGEAHFNLELAHYYQYYTAQTASLVIAVSESDKQKLSQFLDCAAKTIVVPNGLNLQNYRCEAAMREETRTRHNLADEFVVLWGGRVGDFMKSPDIVGKAFSKLVALTGVARLLVAVVQSIPAESTTQLFSHLSDEARNRTIIVHPRCKNELLSLFAAADVFIMPSRYEPFGLMALEAMACELPVIVSPNDGLDDLVEHGRTGLKIQWGGIDESTDSLVSQITALMESPELAKFLAANARISVTKFAIDRTVDRLLDVYQVVRDGLDTRNHALH
jgi:glycosyltransferase involved in cell wall biosynthesis